MLKARHFITVTLIFLAPIIYTGYFFGIMIVTTASLAAFLTTRYRYVPLPQSWFVFRCIKSLLKPYDIFMLFSHYPVYDAFWFGLLGDNE